MWDDPRQLNAISGVLLAAILVAILWVALSWTVRQPAFAFQEVVVRSVPVHVSTAQVEAVIREELAGTFFTMDLDRSRAALARVPWVRTVALRRQWPGRLEVTIDEHVPLARWNELALISQEGKVFTADYYGELPRFNGPEVRAGEVVERYREWSRVLAPLRLAVDELGVSPRGGWHIVAMRTGGSLELELGRDEPTARLARFIAVYGRTIGALARSGTRIEHVDLRYRNGFAARVPGFRERTQKKAT